MYPNLAPAKSIFPAHWSTVAIICGTLLMSFPVHAQVQAPEDAVHISATWSADVARPNEQVVLAVVLEVEDGYHIGNSIDLIPAGHKEAVMPTEIELLIAGKGPKQTATVAQASFPSKAKNLDNVDDSKAEFSQLAGQTIVYVPVKLSPKATAGTIDFELKVTFQACDDKSCFPPATFDSKVSLQVVPTGTLGKGCPAPELFARWSDRRASKPSNKKTGTDYKSKVPPIGPPWVRDLRTAQELALKSGRPIFLYSTKTFCPHCVVVESEMLSAPTLKPHYDKAIWLYVYRDFKGGSEDRNAERIGDRYSLSSWPQLWLIDPQSLETIGETGRTVESFAESISKVKIHATEDLSPVDSLIKSEAQVIAFDRNPTIESAIKLLQSDDIVAQLSACRFLAKQQHWDEITSNANRLLKIPNDGLRYQVLDAVAETGDGDAASKVSQLVKNPRPSRNFNVLRSKAIKALAACGDASSVSVIAPHAQGTARNSTSRVAVNAMLRLVERHPDCKSEVVTALSNSFPPIEPTVARIVVAHAKQVHEHLKTLSGQDIPFPETYDERTREELIKTWSTFRNESDQRCTPKK